MQLSLKKIRNPLAKLFFLFILMNLFGIYSSSQENNCKKADLIIKVMEKYHYKPAELNQEWTKLFIRRLLRDLDPNSTYFLESDYTDLQKKYTGIFEIVSDSQCIFFKEILKIYKLRLSESDSILSQIEKTKINLTIKDSITFLYDNQISFPKDKTEFTKKWNKWIKYNVLGYIFDSEDSLSSDNKQLLSKMPEALGKAITREKNKIARILNYPSGIDNYISAAFFNSISTGYDPHSSYFSYEEKNYFESALSKETESFGIELNTNYKGDIIIDHLIPGGPAWKSGELNKGDILVKLKWEKEKTIDLFNLTIYDAFRILNSNNKGRLDFTIKKSNGKVISVKLMKEKLDVEENIISGHILQGNKKIGYISLPAFYTELENQNGHGCANDVAKEVVKLKREKIEGLILDLRYNGGGSITEAMDLAGIFIDEGPLAITKYRDSKPVTLKDFNRGTIYDGPLLLMVNSQSASASELLAASLQDYHRAIIVGNTTFGKASGQNIFPLDTSDISNENVNDFIKVTVSKLYRISGNTCQLKGVVPDIILPDALSAFGYGEVKYPTALASDSVNKKVNYFPLPQLPIKELSAESNKRISSDERFRQISFLNNLFAKTIKNGRTISLDINSFRKYQDEMENYFLQADTLPEMPSKKFTVENPTFNTQILNYDSYRKELDDVLKKNIHNDIYIDESYKILEDFINLTYKK